jgi:hypothetical protein
MLIDPLTLGSIDERMIAAMRLMLALLALLSTYINPDVGETTHYVAATYAVLVLYLGYSLTLCILAVRRCPPISATAAYWADVGWYILLIGVSKGTNSVFFFFLFFAILVASFQWGFTSGLRVTVVASVLFTGVGFVMAPAEPEFELNSFLLRPTSLFVLGYMIACWGEPRPCSGGV